MDHQEPRVSDFREVSRCYKAPRDNHFRNTQVTELLNDGLGIRLQDIVAAVIRYLGHSRYRHANTPPAPFPQWLPSWVLGMRPDLTIATFGTLVESYWRDRLRSGYLDLNRAGSNPK